jgi:hypothetical protein
MYSVIRKTVMALACVIASIYRSDIFIGFVSQNFTPCSALGFTKLARMPSSLTLRVYACVTNYEVQTTR